MIRYARIEDRDELLSLCLTSLAVKEKEYLEYYFHNIYGDGSALICELDNKLISQVHVQSHVLKLKEKRLEVSFLSNIATHYDYRQRGIMRDLMEIVVEDCSCNHLLTFMEANNPRLFERYGFEVVSKRKRYSIYARELLKYSKKGVSEEVNSKDLLSVYKSFSKRFDCYFDRDETYYEKFIEFASYKQAQICACYEDGICKGYAYYYEMEEGVEIKEIIYEDTKTLCRLLKYAIGLNLYVNVEVTQAEKLEKIFKMSVPRLHNSIMVRINNYKLFNKLYNTNIKSVKELSECLNKPILIHEKC